ncbi:hypothetical protein GCM10009661_82690 [Catellatospora chokoriensis]|uniref:Uncharacterized protein n=1 Tax=Catellatospora chokoriensis TaxID=310353 RepID=A0A8J3K703_9ACTN|nr:hypothetical protein Cch02nite_77650 [Catellatospora chokoriensis]
MRCRTYDFSVTGRVTGVLLGVGLADGLGLRLGDGLAEGDGDADGEAEGGADGVAVGVPPPQPAVSKSVKPVTTATRPWACRSCIAAPPGRSTPVETSGCHSQARGEMGQQARFRTPHRARGPPPR